MYVFDDGDVLVGEIGDVDVGDECIWFYVLW